MAQGNIPSGFGFSREFQSTKDVRHSINAAEGRTYRLREQRGLHSVKLPSSLATHSRTAKKEPFWLPVQATACFCSSFSTLNSRDRRGSSDSRLTLSIPKYTLTHKWLKKSTAFQREDSVKTKSRGSNSQSLEYLVEPQPSVQSSGSEPYLARVHPASAFKESPVKLTSEEIAKLFVKTAPNFVDPLSGIEHGRRVKLTEPFLKMSAFQYTPGGPAAVVTCDCHHIPIVYSHRYNIDITRLYQASKKVIPPTQPMLLDKPAQVHSAIKDRVLALYKPIEALDVAEKYNLFNFVSDAIRRRRVDKIVELMKLAPLRLPKPITWDEFYDCVMHPLSVQMMGSVMACKLAIEVGWGMNIGGGFSHDSTNAGGGLAVYDDVGVCLSLIAEIPTVKHILVVNLDAYQSPCYKYATSVSCEVSIIDFYSELINEDHGYSKKINKDVCYMGFMVRNEEEKSTDYLAHFSSVTRNYLDKAEVMPSLCIYVAGTTVLADNPHTKLKFTTEGVIKRDHTVFQLMKHYKIPIAFLMGGGYQTYDVKAIAMSIIKLSDNDLLDKKLSGKVYRLI